MNKKNFSWALLSGIIMLLGFVSCEQEDRFVGSNVVGDGSAQFDKFDVDLLAQTLMPDSVRADRSILLNATVGAFDEPTLGLNKAYFYSQVRLGNTNPEFGENAVVDSVILSIPVFAQTSDTLATEHRLVSTRYTLSNDEQCTVSDTLNVYETRYRFAMDSIYGNRNASMTLQVHRVTENMRTIDSARFSNQTLSTGELLGSGTITSQVYKTSTAQFSATNSENDSTSLATDAFPIINIKLDGMKDFIQQNVVNMEGSNNLGDQISFINNVLQGIRIGVQENNGFLFTFVPANLNITAFISSDNPNFIDTNGNGIDDDEEDCPVSITKARITDPMNFLIGSSLNAESGSKFYNVVQSQIINTPGNVIFNQSGQQTNYVEGMGGAKVQLSLDAVQIEAVRDSVRNNGWVINEAHIKVYPDLSAQGNWPIPQYLHLYNYSQKKLLPDYGTAETFGTANPQAFPFMQISRPYDEDKGYYLLRITEFVKNIVEGNAPVDDLALTMGNYLGSNSSEMFYTPLNAFFSNQVYNPFRLAVVGDNPSPENEVKKLQLEIFYNQRQN